MDNPDSSSYSVPGTMEDLTLNSTPMPQAASTATKRVYSPSRFDSLMENHLKECATAHEETLQRLQAARRREENKTCLQNRPSLDSAYKSLNEIKNEVKEGLASIRAIKENRNSNIFSSSFQNQQPINSYATRFDLQNIGNEDISSKLSDREITNLLNKAEPSKDFEFVVPSRPARKQVLKYSSLGNVSEKDFGIQREATARLSSISESNYLTGTNKRNTSDWKDNFMQYVPERLSNSTNEFNGFKNANLKEDDRVSVYSSADSSLGIISPETLEDAKNKPIMELSEEDKLDLSQRLAAEFNCDTSKLGKEVELNDLLSSSILGLNNEENKENQRSLSNISDMIRSYSSSDSSSSRVTAKEVSIAPSTINITDLPEKDISCFSAAKPLSGRNSTSSTSSFLRMSTGRINPFANESCASVGSEEFFSGEEGAEKIRTDENAWMEGDGFQRSLSGIHPGADFSVRSQEKLSISSLIRSRSSPVSCPWDRTESPQRPSFGIPVSSPEKKSKPKPILPLPEDKLTFCLSEKVPPEDPAKPWNLQSLIEQYSIVHGDTSSPDVSFPSLSSIGALLKDNASTSEYYNRLLASSKGEKGKHSVSGSNSEKDSSIIVLDDSVLSSCSGGGAKMPSVVAGSQSFCKGNTSDHSTRYSSSFSSDLTLDEEPVQLQARKPHPEPSVIVLNDSVETSVCDVTDFGDDQENCVCVLTPESMDFDVFNTWSRPQRYSVQKSCYVDGRRNDKAALVFIPEPDFVLQPQQQRVVTVVLAAIREGVIKVKLEVTRMDTVTNEKETNYVFGKITAEVPQLSFLNASQGHISLKPVWETEDGRLFGQCRGVVELQNKGRSTVTLELRITEPKQSICDVFFFEEGNKRKMVLSLSPKQTIKLNIISKLPPVVQTEHNSGVVPVTGVVEVHLDSPVQTRLPPITSVGLSSQLVSNFFCAPPRVAVPSEASATVRLFNNGPRAETLHATTSADFSVQPLVFVIQPGNTMDLHITYSGGYNRVGTLTLTGIESQSKHRILLQATPGSVSVNASFVTPRSSRSNSPTSPCSSVGSVGPEEAFQLTCTHKELVWGGCALQQRAAKHCTLKNQSSRREKLLLRVSDPDKCFKVVGDKGALAGETRLSLQPMENRQISVVLLPGTVGPKRGLLTISRINSPSRKKVLPLFGFGGKAKVQIDGVLQDPEQHMWLYLDPEDLHNTFTLTNTGDYSAFVKITEGMSATAVGGGLSIAPPEMILLPGQSVPVEISLFVNAERLEYLLAQPSQTAICIMRLTVIHGDESTRLRLSRIGRLDHKLANKMALLNQLTSSASVSDLHLLEDPPSCAEALWVEDVSEWTVGVLVKRSALESLRLDTSVEFVDLATTMIQ